MKNYRFYEYSEGFDHKGNTVRIDDIFPECQNLAQSFEVYLEKNDLKDVFKLTPKTIIAQNYVGIIKYKNCQFQILPKLLKRKADEDHCILKNLIYMLSYTKTLEIRDKDIAQMAKSQNPFLEVLIKNYADSLFEALKKQISKNYIKEEDNLNFLKGKLLFKEHLNINIVNKARFYCTFDEFTDNNTLNQVFRYVTDCLYLITSSHSTKKTLKHINNLLIDVDLKTIRSCDISNLKLNRTQLIFEKPFQLAKLFIDNSSIDLKQRNFKTISIIFDMNKLFEEYIFELIKKNKEKFTLRGNKLLKIQAQRRKKLFKKSKNLLDSGREITSHFKNTYSDILLEFENNQFLIIDTKYKLKSGIRNDLDNQDIYQMLAYKTINYDKKPEIILMYPEDENKFAWAHYINSENDDNYVALSSISLKQNLKSEKLSLLREIQEIFESLPNC